ncbi:uncharacterized protein N7496_003538 [Penicillium cataractarum]|uniref:Hydrophobin n=1 Tax=Penicillium cataractarum TaxID=2100454 RepID=A0A9W9SMF8_9EURO|nr:uncharacterized protein N7496_003538 [Penicillium cataractarum]KAJ5381110.1 hypothetical protein N7496_003538 [Penicillium cataractarum]
MNLITLFLAIAPVLAMPLEGPGVIPGLPGDNNNGNDGGSAGPLCFGPTGNVKNYEPRCCKAGVDLGCKAASGYYTNSEYFKAACTSVGLTAKCCNVASVKTSD